MQAIRKNLLILCLSIVCIAVITGLARLLGLIEHQGVRFAARVGLNLLNGLTAYAAMKLTDMKLDIDFRNRRQYLIGIVIALALALTIAVVPALCGFSLVGGHTEWSWPGMIRQFLFCVLIVGPVEEFVFRVYLQDVFVSFFENKKWLGVVIASALFGLSHLINGNLAQVIFTFGIGLVFGFARYKLRDCGYVGVAFGHGLYDFLIVIVRVFVVR